MLFSRDRIITGSISRAALQKKDPMPDISPAPATAPASVTVVSVAYNSFGVLPEMAQSLPVSCPLVIVDNGPDDGLRAWAQAHGHRLIVSDENLGFGRACNLGAQGATSDFIFFLNPDARLSPEALPALLDAAARNPQSPAFGPAFQDDSAAPYKVRPSKILKRSLFAPRYLVPENETTVPSLNGAGMLVRRSAFEAIGGFDDNIFLFFEDDDISLTLSKQVGPLTYVPAAHVYHAIGGSSPETPALLEFKAYHYTRGYIYAMRKHGRHFGRLRVALSVLTRALSPKTFSNEGRRANLRGRLRGLRSML